MTAPRVCRRCGAALSPNIMWCTLCYEPVRQLTPRDRQLPPLAAVEEPPEGVRRSPLRGAPEPRVYSRWKAGPTTFGPVGRILITLLVAAFFPWGSFVGFGSALGPLLLWYLMGYTFLATFVLRHVWRKGRVEDPGSGAYEGLRSRVARRAPRLARPIRLDARVILPILAITAVVVIGLGWARSDTAGRYYMVAIGGVIGGGAFLAWWNEL